MSSSDGSRPQTSEGNSRAARARGSVGLGAAVAGFESALGDLDDSVMRTGSKQDPLPATSSMEEQYSRTNLSTAQSTSIGGDTMGLGGWGEVEIAEVETRIRRSILELIAPTIRKTSTMEGQMLDLRAELHRSTSMITDLARVSVKVEEQVVVVEGFREELVKWEAERRTVQAHIADNLMNMKLDLDAFRHSLERKDASMHGMQRTMDRMVGELSKLQEGSEALRQHVELRLAQTGKVLNGAKTDLECKLITLETRHNRLSDELWAEVTGLARASTNITNTNELVLSLSEEMKRMQHDKANTSQLEAMQDEVNKLISDANVNVTMLKQTVDTMVNDVKAHFKTATNTVAAHNASMLSEVRASYQQELSHAAQLRTDVMDFMQETGTNVSRIESAVQEAQEVTAEKVKDVSEGVDELSRCRKLDNSNYGLQGLTMKEQLSKVASSSESVGKCLEHFGSVIAVMLKSDRVASALAQQENSDRAKVALMGYRENKGQARPSTTSKLNKKKSSGLAVSGTGEASDAGEAVISVDNRCLSCSGQAQTVLSGFKMACLQYAPGPVTFSKKLYKREELLDLRQKLLEQAQEQLAQGPAGGNLADFTSSSNRSNMHHELSSSMHHPASQDVPGQSIDGNVSASKPRALPPLSDNRPMTAR